MANKNPNTNKAWPRCINFIVIFCLLASLAMVVNGRFLGIKLTNQQDTDKQETIVKTPEGEIINTTEIGKSILGYGGPLPIEIHISEGEIDSISILENSETPVFLNKVKASGLQQAWDGMTIEEASHFEPDAVSGATYSSKALINNVNIGIAYALDNNEAVSSPDKNSLPKLIAALVVILAGAMIPLFYKNKTYRLIQQLLNVAVLGFWTGTFIDYSMMLNVFSNGISFTLSSTTMIALLVVGLIYPLFKRGGHYCAWVCPLGSLQELAGHLSTKKIHLSNHVAKYLDIFRQALWVILMLCLYLGIATQWIDYELFSGFIIRSASWIVLTVGGTFLLLSIFIPRPFCRFMCPTGSLLKDA